MQFEESLDSHQSAEKSLTEQLRELNQQRERAQQEVGTFKHLHHIVSFCCKMLNELKHHACYFSVGSSRSQLLFNSA